MKGPKLLAMASVALALGSLTGPLADEFINLPVPKEPKARKDPNDARVAKAEAKRQRKAAKRRDNAVKQQLGQGTYEAPK